MRMSAQDQAELGVIDRVVAEPGAGAHVDAAETGRRLRAVILEELDKLAALSPDELVSRRGGRYRVFGAFDDLGVSEPIPGAGDRPGLADRLRRALEPVGKSVGDALGDALGGRTGRDARDARDARNTLEGRDGRDGRETREPREGRDGRDEPPAREEV
jgi:hypothetical protein